MASTEVTVMFGVVRNDEDVELEILAKVHGGRPAYIGLPENSYPAEDPEVDILSVKSGGAVWAGELTDEENDRLFDIVIDEAAESEADRYDSYPDDDREYELDYNED